MILWALVFGMSLTLESGKLDMGAQVEAVFKTEKECRDIKARLDKNSKEAIDKGQIMPEINSFGAVCVPVTLDTHNKKPMKGA